VNNTYVSLINDTWTVADSAHVAVTNAGMHCHSDGINTLAGTTAQHVYQHKRGKRTCK